MRFSKQVLILTLLSLALPSLVAAQNRERFGISAKAGGVNAVVGRVMVTRQGQEPQLLSQTEDVGVADVVTTGSTANVEILLNPGSYLRLAENSEFKFENISLDNLSLRLQNGSAIVEATGVADMNLGIKVVTPHAEFTIIRSGIYRINVQADSSELAVKKGRASFGSNKTDIVKGGSTITIGKGFVASGKLSKEKDTFEAWSKERAQYLAKANERLSSRNLSSYLSSYNRWDSWFWSARSPGLWTFSSRFGCYTFLPFYNGWSSPYGHWYGSYYWRGSGYWNPTFVNNQLPSGSGSGSSAGGGSSTGGGGIITGGGGNGGGGITPIPGGMGGGGVSERPSHAGPRDVSPGGRRIDGVPRPN